MNSDSVDEVITIEEYETFKTLICNGYTYSEAKSAIVVGEKMNFSVELLCEAKIQSIEDKSNGKEIDTTYSEVSRKLGIPENAVEFYLKENRSLTKEALLDIGEEAILQQYGGEMSSTASVRATASTPTVQYSPTHVLDNPYDYKDYGDLDVNLASGSFRYSETDLSIPGINGLDLNFTRIYDSKFSYTQVPYGLSTGSYDSSNTLRVGYDVYITYDFDNYEGFTLVSNPEDYYIVADEKYGDEYNLDFSANTYDTAGVYYNTLFNEADGSLYLVTDPDGNDAVAKMQPYLKGIGMFNFAFEHGKTPYRYLINEFGLGHGWRLGFSAIERVYSITADEVYWNLILSDGSVYRVKENGTLEDPPGNFTLNWNDTSYSGSRRSITHKNGTKEYFDSNGRNIAIVDRYGNTIKLEYTVSGSVVTQIKITDTLGNIVLYKQEVVENPDENGYGTIDEIGSDGDHDMIWSLNLNGERIRTYYIEKESATDMDDFRHIVAIEDEVGNYNIYSTNSVPREYNCFVLTPSTNDGTFDYAGLSEVEYPNGLRYMISTSWTTINGNVPYERFNGYGYQESLRLISHNFRTPTCYGKYESDSYSNYYGDHTGYASLWTEDSRYIVLQFKERALYDPSSGNGIWNATRTEYLFNNEHELVNETVYPYSAVQDEQYPPFSNSPKKMTRYSVTDYSYNAKHLPTRISTKYYEPVLVSSGTNPTSYMSQVTSYTYDSKGNVLTETLPNGMVTTYTYDSSYNVPLTKTYKQDASTTIVEQNTLTSDKKAVAQTIVTSNGTAKDKVTYTYDSKGRMISMNDYSSGNVHTTQLYDYNNGAQVTQVTTGGIHVEATAYNTRGWPVTLTDANGEVTTISYDGTGRITQVTYPDGGTESYAYDVVNNTVTFTDISGHIYTYKYDYFGNLIEIFSETAQTALSTYKYDSLRQKYLDTVHSLDSSKDISTYNYYDNLGRLIETGIRNSDGTNTTLETYTYEANLGKTTKTTIGGDGTPNKVETSYVDNMGNIIRTGRILNGTEYTDTYTYDYLGNQIESKSAYTTSRNGSYSTQNTYDHIGNILTSKDALGNIVTNAYDWNGNLLISTDAKGNVSTYTYDALGRMLTATTPIDDTKSSIVQYVYDPVGNVIEQRSGKGTEVSNGLPTSFTSILYSYDELGRLVSVEQPVDSLNSDVTTYTYDNAGNMLTSSVGYRKTGDALTGTPSVTTYTYDQFGNALTMTDPLGKVETYTYDLNGNVLTKVDRNGVTTTYTYDNRGRLTNESIGSGEAAINRSCTYGLNGNLLTLSEGSNTIGYVYDELGRLVSETDGTYTKGYTYNIGDLRTGLTVADVTATRISNTYTYDDLGRLSTVSGGGATASYAYDANGNLSNTTLGNGITQSYTYNKANQITQMTAQKDGTNVSSYSYGYDLAGRRISTVDLIGTTTYTYDDLGRLTSEIGPDVSNSFTYDTKGNRSTSTKNNVTTTYTYDLANRLLNSVTNGITTSYTYDDNGNTLTSKEGSNSAIQYSYNAANQQVGYTDSNNNNNITATYLYNPDGLRKAKTINGITTGYGWDGDDIVVETTAGTPITYVRGLQLVSYNAGSDTNISSYYLHDGHGNVTYLTNSNGAVTDTYRYDAFGSQLNTMTALNPFQYCGEYLDSENGNYYLRARNYTPDLGRFTQWDSYAGEITNPISLNHYVYCYNDPIGYVDPTGHWGESALDLLSAGISFKDLIEDPSLVNGLFFTWDAFALAIPILPAAGTVKYLDDVADVGKVVDKGSDVVEAIGKAAIKRADEIDRVVNAAKRTVEDLISNLPETTRKKGISRNFESSGGFEQTLKDFESLDLIDVKEIKTQYGTGKVGRLSDGTSVVARPGSKTDGATLEIQISNTKNYKIRY